MAGTGPYAPTYKSSDWSGGVTSTPGYTMTGAATQRDATSYHIDESAFVTPIPAPTYSEVDHKPEHLGGNVEQDPVKGAKFKTAWDDNNKRQEMLNNRKNLIQNETGFPYQLKGPNGMLAAQYDYQIIPGDKRYKGNLRNLEYRLQQFRTSVGYPVHGNTNIARSMKFYMYNRWKVPDINLAYNRTTTHVFFTRPDLNLLMMEDNEIKIAPQILKHTESALMWYKNPELFKLLSYGIRIGDANNFNMLLSNQITNFQFPDEELGTTLHGQSWNDHAITYGQNYKGRTAGTFSCTFEETSELSVINLMKLWITYIDNISRGAWHPSYDESYSPVWERALDYAASVYVFKCGEDGENILYWTKYYGIFPTNTGVSALNWEKGEIRGAPQVTINFAYSYKKDFSPISLVEFNSNAKIEKNVTWIPNFDVNTGKCSRPYVGTPYIEFDITEPKLGLNDVNMNQRSQLRLKFQRDSSAARTDKKLFRANYDNGGSAST